MTTWLTIASAQVWKHKCFHCLNIFFLKHLSMKKWYNTYFTWIFIWCSDCFHMILKFFGQVCSVRILIFLCKYHKRLDNLSGRVCSKVYCNHNELAVILIHILIYFKDNKTCYVCILLQLFILLQYTEWKHMYHILPNQRLFFLGVGWGGGG